MPPILPKTINEFEELVETGKQTAVQKVSQVTTQAAQQVSQNVEATNKAVSGQLSGGDPGAAGETPGATQQNDQANKDFVKDLYGPSKQNPTQAQSQNGQATPNDQQQLADAREKLKLHMESYGNQFTLEGEQARLQKQQKQEEEQKKQLEAQQKEEEEKKKQEQMQAQVPMPHGKKTGVPDFVLKREQNKTEMNRGTSG